VPKKKNSRKKNKGSTKTISSNTTSEQRKGKKQISTAAIETIRQIVDMLKPFELSKTQRLHTYQSMMLDDAVGNAFAANSVLIEKAFSNYEVSWKNDDEDSKLAAEFLKWNLDNLGGYQTVRSIARSAAEFKRDGLAPFEKTHRKGWGEWEDHWILDRLNYIHPLSLDKATPFSIEGGGRYVTEMRQSLSAFRNSTDSINTSEFNRSRGYIPIPRNKLTFTTYSATDAQPFGTSAFDACYTAWREKVLIQDYTLVGVTKDFSGTPVLYIPEDILAEASNNPSGPEADMVNRLRSNMANMHTGDQSYTILPSDTQNPSGTGVRDYEIKFLGVEGGGKAFDVEALVEQRKKAIYNSFGAANLITGENGGGSYNLISGQNTIHAHFVERDISVIEEAWNRDIIPQLFRLNEWNLSYDQLPKIVAGEIEEVSLDETGKFIQRVGTSGYLPIVPEVINHILKSANIDYRVSDKMSTEDLKLILSDNTSRSGEGAGTSGTGDSQSSGNNNNMENTA
jgi:hypothetical protein